MIAAVTAAGAVVLAMRKSLAAQQAERELWAEATDDVLAPRPASPDAPA